MHNLCYKLQISCLSKQAQNQFAQKKHQYKILLQNELRKDQNSKIYTITTKTLENHKRIKILREE